MCFCYMKDLVKKGGGLERMFDIRLPEWAKEATPLGAASVNNHLETARVSITHTWPQRKVGHNSTQGFSIEDLSVFLHHHWLSIVSRKSSLIVLPQTASRD